MSSPKRDTQREKLYRAERDAIFKTSKRYETIPEIEAYYAKIIKSKWFEKHGVRYIKINGVEIKDGRGTRNCFATGLRTINMPKWGRMETVMLHELAHIIIGFQYPQAAWHGREFAHTYLLLVKRWMGKEAHDALKASFKKHHVKYTIRRNS